MSDTKGLYGKYIITRSDGTPVNGRCFILRPDKDPAAVTALQAYAAATDDEQLRDDLYAWVGKPLTIDAVPVVRCNMRANRTAATYNEYILKNSYVWKGNVPDDIRAQLVALGEADDALD